MYLRPFFSDLEVSEVAGATDKVSSCNGCGEGVSIFLPASHLARWTLTRVPITRVTGLWS